MSSSILGSSTVRVELVLQSTHSDEAALKVYAVHPLHLECGKLMTALAENRQALDYEIEE